MTVSSDSNNPKLGSPPPPLAPDSFEGLQRRPDLSRLGTGSCVCALLLLPQHGRWQDNEQYLARLSRIASFWIWMLFLAEQPPSCSMCQVTSAGIAIRAASNWGLGFARLNQNQGRSQHENQNQNQTQVT